LCADLNDVFDFIQVSFLLQKGADAFSVDSKGQSSLHLAAKCGNPEIIQQILQANVPVDIMDSHGTTALMLAAGGGQEQVLSMLLSAGAKIQGTNKDGQNALKLACHGGHVGMVKALGKVRVPLNTSFLLRIFVDVSRDATAIRL
jgi:ankyrin repeat protein